MSKTKYTHEENKLWLVALVLAGFIFLFELTGILQPVRNLMVKFTQPLEQQGAQLAQGLLMPVKIVKAQYKAYLRIQDLELRLAESQAQVGHLSALLAQKEYLANLLTEVDLKLGEEYLVVPVIGFNQPMIGLGKQKAQLGNPVLVANTVVGLISKIGNDQAEVRLLAQSFAPTLLVKTETGVKGIIQGDGKRVILSEISREDELIVGERVLTLGQPGVPSNLYVGSIQNLLTKSADPVQSAVLEQYVSFYEASLVEVRY